MADGQDRKERLEKLRREREAKVKELDDKITNKESSMRKGLQARQGLDQVKHAVDDVLFDEEQRKEKLRRAAEAKDEKLRMMAAAEEENRRKQEQLQAMIEALQKQAASQESSMKSAEEAAANARSKLQDLPNFPDQA